MHFDFATATRILFGAGRVREVAALVAEQASRVLVIHGRTAGRAEPLMEDFKGRGLACERFAVAGEPTLATAESGVKTARESGCDWVVGVGGGSVLDAGKAIAALLTNGGEPLDYLEGIGRGRPITRPAAPYVAIPTTAGTGSEVTRNAVLGSPEHRVKVSMRSPLMLPRVAVVDPELTVSMPPSLTASTGLDALTQLTEAFVSSKANPLTDGICQEGLRKAGRSLRSAFREGANLAAREAMALASLFSGLALANAGLGAVHGFAGPLGGLFDAPHGAVCARLLPPVMAANVRALRARAPGSPSLAKYDVVARLLTEDPGAHAEAGVAWAQQLTQELKVPPLSSYGLRESDLPLVVDKSMKASSMKGNPVPLTEEELAGILREAL